MSAGNLGATIGRPGAPVLRGAPLGANLWRRSLAVAFAIALALSALAALAGRESELGSGAQPATQSAPAALAPSAGLAPLAAPSTTPAAVERRAERAYAKLPLTFVPNAGQTDERVLYHAQGAGFNFYFTDDRAVLAFQKGKRGHALDLRFLGANPNAKLEASERGTGTVNYLTGSERHTNLPTYEQLTYRELWPGIDMTFRGAGGKLKYEFHLAAGANPADIRLAYAGAEGLSLGAGGALLIDTPLGALRDSRPQSFQRVDGRRVPVESSYALGGASAYGFHLGGYDRGRPLVIDPGLVYSTYLGGTGDEDGGIFGVNDIAVDSTGSAYVTGTTESDDFPTTPTAFQPACADPPASGCSDAFVTKLDPSGALAYSTFLGGTGDEGPGPINPGGGDYGGIAVDAAGSAYVTGMTQSGDFPTTATAFQSECATEPTGECVDAFVTKLDPSGSTLAYSTFLGGINSDRGRSIALDDTGSAYVTGFTISDDFPTTPAALDTDCGALGPACGGDAFVTKLDPSGSALAYSTYLGGAGGEDGRGIAVDGTGSAYVTGLTDSDDFPTAAAFDSSQDGLNDAFVSKLDPSGSTLAYSTFLGGTDTESSDAFNFGGGTGAIAVDDTGSAYVIGTTVSDDFPTTPGALDTDCGPVGPAGCSDAFVTKLDPSGSTLAYSTFLGGAGADGGMGIAVDGTGSAYATGFTHSVDFPITPGALDTDCDELGPSECLDAFVTKLDPSGLTLAYSTFLGGESGENGRSIAVDGTGGAYVIGLTQSADFPTVAAFQPECAETPTSACRDLFVTKLDTGPGPPATLDLTPAVASNPVDSEHCVTATAKDAAGDPTPDVTVRFSVTGSITTSGPRTTDANGEATFCYTGLALPGADTISAFADTNGNGSDDGASDPDDTATKTWTLPDGTPCVVKITNGGWIVTDDGDRGSFGGNARETSTGDTSGNEHYQDHGPAEPMNVKSINVQSVTCSPDETQASIFGQATINGSGTYNYRIDVQDNGEPGKLIDQYRIRLDNGYDSGDHILRGGNVQIH
jgi:hypothetical protein